MSANPRTSENMAKRQFLHATAANVALPWAWTAGAAPAAEPFGRPPVPMRSPHRVEVRPHRGRTAILVNGQPITGMSYYSFGSLTLFSCPPA
jgi:hypothetical protein